MSGKTVIDKDQLQLIIDANRSVLETALELLRNARQGSVPPEVVQRAAASLVTSGTTVNVAVSTIPGVASPSSSGLV